MSEHAPGQHAPAGSASSADMTETDELAAARAAHSLSQQLEALLIVADEPLDASTLAAAVLRPVTEVRAVLAQLQAEYDDVSGAPRGFELREVPTGFRFYVRASLDAVVADFVQQERSARLSQAALETLAVIAYRQPVTRGQVAQIRAVNVDSVVRTLLSHGLVAEVGRHEETGATLYGTTAVLLDKLGINDIAELPHISPLLDDGAEGFEHEVL